MSVDGAPIFFVDDLDVMWYPLFYVLKECIDKRFEGEGIRMPVDEVVNRRLKEQVEKN